MEFRLTYEGRMASGASASAKHKHDIRRVLHRQLSKLWDSHPYFKDSAPWTYKDAQANRGASRKEQLAEKFSLYGYQFVPVVLSELLVFCSLDILFLRPDPPGQLLRSGDLDNRLKTLFDSLKLPGSAQDLGGYDAPQANETPFFVLLEDDRLVTRVSVETDRHDACVAHSFPLSTIRIRFSPVV